MVIYLYGDALRLLEHFIYYATGGRSKDLADAMQYNRQGFLARARLLEEAFLLAEGGEAPPASAQGLPGPATMHDAKAANGVAGASPGLAALKDMRTADGGAACQPARDAEIWQEA